MSDVPPPPGAWPPPSGGPPPPPPPPSGFGAPPPGYVAYNPAGPSSTIDAAGFWIRFLAFLIDGLIIGIPFFILGEIFTDDPTTTTTFSNGTTTTTTDGVNFTIGWNSAAPLWLNTLNTLVGLTYFGYFEGGASGQTLGKRIAGIRVVDATTGQPGIGFARAVGRYFSRILSAIPCLLGYFWMLWDDRKQTWHDKLVSTSVSRT